MMQSPYSRSPGSNVGIVHGDRMAIWRFGRGKVGVTQWRRPNPMEVGVGGGFWRGWVSDRDSVVSCGGSGGHDRGVEMAGDVDKYATRISEYMVKLGISDQTRRQLGERLVQYKSINGERVKDIFICNERAATPEGEPASIW